ncbi:mitochondrial intermembrane space import and assembly protein 40-like [Gigantopelta aegis]|uniref:mitochondrial intermembrane space import and assembly protein 40-like n=1 Tax=Gigantopelta aegis TaxID=1735272 RepID=UPI001B88AB66|nr:mitochondrial intermembrane space import and assembly protein 40-like [Gigantopelta aegis]
MSYCRENGKDHIIFATKEDLDKPSAALITANENSEEPGLILPNGDINWNCPCLGGMASGPCGVEFREAFSCFHYSTADAKGSDCYEQFYKMQECMSQYPDLYPAKESEEETDDDSEMSIPDQSSVDKVLQEKSVQGTSFVNTGTKS